MDKDLACNCIEYKSLRSVTPQRRKGGNKWTTQTIPSRLALCYNYTLRPGGKLNGKAENKVPHVRSNFLEKMIHNAQDSDTTFVHGITPTQATKRWQRSIQALEMYPFLELDTFLLSIIASNWFNYFPMVWALKTECCAYIQCGLRLLTLLIQLLAGFQRSYLCVTHCVFSKRTESLFCFNVIFYLILELNSFIILYTELKLFIIQKHLTKYIFPWSY